MNKSEFIRNMQENGGYNSQREATQAYDAFVATVLKALKDDEKIQLAGFGTFEVAERAARTGKNPQTGKEIKIAASKAPKFKAGKALKDLVNTKKKKK